MFKGYLAIALRHLLKQRLYSAINVAGLAVGLACFILIALYVQHERGYDRQFANADRIYRVSRDFLPTAQSKAAYLATIAAPAAALLKQDFPDVEHVARIQCCGGVFRTAGGDVVSEPDLAAADNELFQIFDFHWLQGDAKTALAAPFTVVLTQSIARKYFGDANPVGKTLLLDGKRPLQVTGVIADLGDSTHLRFSMLTSIETNRAIYGDAPLESWGYNNFYTYVLLKPGADPAAIERGSADFFERRFQQGSSLWTRLAVTPLTDIHLRSNKENEMRVPGSAAIVETFSAIAVFILLLACINFMNLATARSVQRAKEIGVRKAIGAGRDQVVAQFLAESVLVAAIALLLGMVLVELALPAFDAFLGLTMKLDYLTHPAALAGLAALALLTGVAAGSYPAFYLAAFDPARVLKGDTTRGGGAAAFRRTLVVLQFAISIGLLIATAVVYQQMRFARSIDLGYDKDRVVVVDGSFTAGLGKQWEALKHEWLANPNITQVTASNLTPGMQNTNAIGVLREGGEEHGAGVAFLWVDYGFFETYGIQPLAGRTFDERHGTDRGVAPALAPADSADARAAARAGTYVISASLARRYGWTPEQAVGKWLEMQIWGGGRGTIVGVVPDVYLESLRKAVEPMIYVIPALVDPAKLGYAPLQHASLRISGRDLAATLKYIDEKWRQFVPDQPVSRHFLDQDFAALYAGEERQGRMFSWFAGLAIAIACLGLFGLASFTTERRTKEIGIRKVVGGGVADIVLLFCGEFGKLVLVANVLAWPVAYFMMRRWLDTFAYRVSMSLLVYAGSGLVALVIACATVGAVAARAASAKPIKALRSE